jgi:cytochrome c551/c552
MIYDRPTGKLKFHIPLLSLVLLLFFSDRLYAQDGKALFSTNCASCHNPFKQVIGPALKGAQERVGNNKLLHDWVHNSSKVLADKNPYFSALYEQYGKVSMTPFPQLTDKEIDAVFKYIADVKPPTPPTGGPTSTAAAEESDNTLLYGILTLILAVIMFVLLQVNSSLKKLSDDKEGIPAAEPIPFYRNKVYITLVILVLFVVGGYWLVQGAIGLGRSQDYQPEQPIFYSHKVHAGVNQISCLYCHSNAMDSRHATVPPLNVCMNCHMQIDEYHGADLYRADGSKVDANAEIQKLYSYTGWDPKSSTYANQASAHPVEWIKIHNLPDHVFFSHAQHTKAGQVQCQTCHGPMQEYDEVKQFAPLSMGWCINCHRTTKVNFPDSAGNGGNKFYSIYERFHRDLKSGDMDSVTVKDIGGTECQKCHY